MSALISYSPERWAALSAPLLSTLDGAQLQKIRAPDPQSIALRLRSPGVNTFLLLSADPRAPRLSTLTTQPETMSAAPALLSWARSTLRGHRLCRLDWSPLRAQLGGGVYCQLHFTKGSLLLELDGAQSNLYGLDEDGVIRAWARALPSRGLSLAARWSPPALHPDQFGPEIALFRERPEACTSLEALERFAREKLDASTAAQLDADRRRLLKRARKKLERRMKALEGDLARAEEGRAAQRLGELLKGEAHRLKRGLSSVSVTDWFDPALPRVEIPLDPRLDGPENLQSFFKRARRAIRGEALARARLEETELALLELEELATERREGESLEALEAQLWRAGLYRPPPQRSKKSKAAQRKPYQLFLSAQGERILVGRGGRDNHLTTFQVARGRDLWLHVRDAAGAHVIVPVERDGEAHRETLLDAAALAVHHSKLRGEEKVSVRCCARKYVRAVSGAAPGRVSVSTGGRELLATEVDQRIQRLYAERPRSK
ncbi:MAG: NFACT family protein [Myxococcota bacterium]|nr:NFACT family protein [Myxococcota bacterium]